MIPGARLSLQKHHYRSEKWNIVSDRGIVTLNGHEITVDPGSIMDVPVGAIHRIANICKTKLVFIEVACGDNLSENNIDRIVDDYARDVER